MDNYIDIKLLPDPEFKTTTLMNALYAKVHKVLHDLESSTIGVSFPESKHVLGDVLRLHGGIDALSEFATSGWLGGLSGYCLIGNVAPAPEEAKHRTVSRWQSSKSESGLRRAIKRAEKRGKPMSDDDISKYRQMIVTEMQTEDSLPYLYLQSGSNGHKHRRYIQFGELRDSPVAGSFDTFGLSKTATVPWF